MGVDPTGKQLEAFVADAPDGPLVMVNLLKFADREAYYRYAAVALQKVSDRGGRVIVASDAWGGLIGDSDWDEVAVVEYPTKAAFLDMLADPEYVAALEHRTAGLERTELIVTTAITPPN